MVFVSINEFFSPKILPQALFSLPDDPLFIITHIVSIYSFHASIRYGLPNTNPFIPSSSIFTSFTMYGTMTYRVTMKILINEIFSPCGLREDYPLSGEFCGTGQSFRIMGRWCGICMGFAGLRSILNK